MEGNICRNISDITYKFSYVLLHNVQVISLRMSSYRKTPEFGKRLLRVGGKQERICESPQHDRKENILLTTQNAILIRWYHLHSHLLNG